MKVLIEFEEGEENIPQIEKQLNCIKSSSEPFRSDKFKFNIGGCFIKSLETVKNKTTCELSYDFIEPTFISLNEIKEPERPKMEEVKEDYNPFKLIKDLLCRKNEKKNSKTIFG